MKTSNAPESFRDLLLRHRGRTGLIQRDLAARAGVSRGAVQDWEAGLNYPTTERLQALIQVLLEAGGLTLGREAAEARELWAAAEREAPRMHTPFDEAWFATLLAARAAPPSVERAQDWGEATDTLGFVGRADELALLRRWVLDEGRRLIAILGMGGIGKTSLAARLAQDVAPSFERVYWRSLRDAQPVSEQQVLRLLAIEREPVSLGALLGALGPRVGRAIVLEAVEALRRRSLVERTETPGAPAFMLQSVVLEYVTDGLVEVVADEIGRGQPALLVEEPLIKAQAKDYVRQTQERLIGRPILRLLNPQHAEVGREQRLLALLAAWRARPAAEQRYGPGNVVNLLRLLRGDLRGLDLSHLAIRQAYLADVDAQDAKLVGAQLVDTVLAEAFNFPGNVAVSGDGSLLAAGTSSGAVWLWRVADRKPLLAVQGHSGTVWAVALSGNGQLAASGGGDRTGRLWETTAGRAVATLHGHSGTVWGVALSADGQLVASGSGDATVRLWEASTGRPLTA